MTRRFLFHISHFAFTRSRYSNPFHFHFCHCCSQINEELAFYTMYSTKSINIGAGYSCQSHFISLHLIEKTKKSFEWAINFIFANLVLLNARWHTTRSTSIDKDDDQKLCGVCIERNQPLEIKKGRKIKIFHKNKEKWKHWSSTWQWQRLWGWCGEMYANALTVRAPDFLSQWLCVCVAVFGN